MVCVCVCVCVCVGIYKGRGRAIGWGNFGRAWVVTRVVARWLVPSTQRECSTLTSGQLRLWFIIKAALSRGTHSVWGRGCPPPE